MSKREIISVTIQCYGELKFVSLSLDYNTFIENTSSIFYIQKEKHFILHEENNLYINKK